MSEEETNEPKFKKLPLPGQLRVGAFLGAHFEDLKGKGLRAAYEACLKELSGPLAEIGIDDLTEGQVRTIIDKGGFKAIYSYQRGPGNQVDTEALQDLTHRFATAMRRTDDEITSLKVEINELQRRPGLQDAARLQIRLKNLEDRQSEHLTLMYEICHAISELQRHTKMPKNSVIEEMAKGRKLAPIS